MAPYFFRECLSDEAVQCASASERVGIDCMASSLASDRADKHRPQPSRLPERDMGHGESGESAESTTTEMASRPRRCRVPTSGAGVVGEPNRNETMQQRKQWAVNSTTVLAYEWLLGGGAGKRGNNERMGRDSDVVR